MNDRDMAADVIAEIEVQRLQAIQLMRCHADRLKKKAHRRGKEIEHLQTVIRGAWTQVRTVVRLKKEAEAERDALRARVAQFEAAAKEALAALALADRYGGMNWEFFGPEVEAACDALVAALTPLPQEPEP